MKKILSFFILIIFCYANVFSQKLEYIQKTGDNTKFFQYEIEKTSSGYLFKMIRKTEDTEIYQEAETTDSYETLNWKHIDKKNKTEVYAVRKNNTINLSGIHKGRKIEINFNVKDLPWNQYFPVVLGILMKPDNNAIRFWAIGSEGLGDMKIAKFKASSRGIKSINFRGKDNEVHHIQVTFDSWMSIFWKGHFYYRLSDDTYIIDEYKNTRTELINK